MNALGVNIKNIMSKRLLASVALISLGAPAVVMAHGGGVDSLGGHTNKKTGEYHCHKEPCLSALGQVENATKSAEAEGVSFSVMYNRKDWPHWSDLDGDCMNTRHEALRAQAVTNVTLSSDRCSVASGVWYDPFGGAEYTDPQDVDVDHIVPLKWANGHGASGWSRAKKEAFANDPENLLVVDDGLNSSKGAKGPDEWMPPNKGFHCQYLQLWEHVLKKYPSLSMTSGEQGAFDGMVGSCMR